MNKILQNKKIITHTLIILAIILLAVISLQASFAATTNINNTTGGGINGALSTSNPGDIIELDEGTYTGNNNTNMTINKNITIQGKTKDKVILDAQGLTRIFSLSDNLNVKFINITFLNGNYLYGGGAIGGTNITMTFIDCVFTKNRAGNHGGAIYGAGNSNITVIGCEFNDNAAPSLGGVICGYGNITVIGCEFNNNTGSQGGTIYIQTYMDLYGTLMIINSNFTNNTAGANGGAIFIPRGVNVSMKNSVFINNSAATHGGAIYINGDAIPYITVLDIINSTFIGNTATYHGGAIRANNRVDISITNSAFDSNMGVSGGAVSISGSNMNLNNSTFDSNVGVSDGVIYIQASNVTISNSTINNNEGDGVYVDNGTVNITNNEINGNNGNGVNNNGNATITDNIINDNVGDGVKNGENGTADITDNEIIGNGGHGVNNDGDATINDNVINDNVGDGVKNGENGNVDITNNEIVGNGGHGVNNDGDATIDDNVINDNAGDGINNGPNGTADITNNEIGGNGGHGVNNDGDATINDNILSNNGGVDEIVNNGVATGSGNNQHYTTKISIITNVSSNKITIKTTVRDNRGNLLVGRTVNFYINGVLVGTGTTNSQGIAEFTYTTPKAGIYNILAKVDEFNETNTFGTKIYSAANNTTNVNILSKDTIIVVSAPTIKEGKKTNIKVTLKDTNSNILKNKKVSLTIKGKTYTATTNNNGIAIFKIAGLKGGKHTVTAKFAGDNNYKSSTTKAVQKVISKSNLGIVSIKKLPVNKRVSTYRVTIANTGSLKSKSTVLALFHMRKGIKIKTKYIKIKSIAPGKKISIIVSYFPDKANHRYCIAHFQVDPKNKNKEILLANNKKSISLKH